MSSRVALALFAFGLVSAVACGSESAPDAQAGTDAGSVGSSTSSGSTEPGSSSGGASGALADASTDPTVNAPYTLPDHLPGVNASGAEFQGKGVPGRYGYDYSYPTHADLDYLIGKGLVFIRLPFRWKRLQREVQQPFDAEELARLQDTVAHVISKGGYVVLDPHDYGRRDGIIGSGAEGAATQADFADFWSRLATVYAGEPRVAFGLMNEPNKMSTELWLENANAAIGAIRATGARNVIAVPGNAWTGAWNWLKKVDGFTASGDVMGGVVDPLDNFIYEMHQYLDEYSSGDPSKPCVSTTIGSERLVAATGWLRERGRRAFIGEIGVGKNETCLAALEDMLTYMDANRDVWQGWTYWSAGSRWNPEYDYSLQRLKDSEVDRPQMGVLTSHL